jgi:HAD superfamily hydrolase (TIGR01509 family)
MNEKSFAVIFDMDGVLIDSPKYIWESFNILVKPYGIHFNDSDIKKYLGKSLQDQIVEWKKDYNVDVGDFKDFSSKALTLQMELISKNIKTDEDLLKLLKELKNNNVPMGVGTSSTKDRAHKIISFLNIDEYFTTIVTSEDVKEHKPNPHIFLEVAKRLNISPENCIVIEDARDGIIAAKNGNMKSIGYLTNLNNTELLSDADMIINNFSKISYEELKTLFK